MIVALLVGLAGTALAESDCESLLQVSGACKHGQLLNGVCVCTSGFCGPTCSVPFELCARYHSSLHPHQAPIGNMTCDPTNFAVYPYAAKAQRQQSLWGVGYSGWETCIGLAQSPINIITSQATKVDVPYFLQANYVDQPNRAVWNNGHSLQVNGLFGNLTINGETFEANQFHFHSRGEHEINGALAPAEMHIVHNIAGTPTGVSPSKAAVVGILFDIGEENLCLKNVLASPAPRAGCMKSIGTVSLKCFLPQLTGDWWNYQGSLTTPPYSEIVNWNVMTKRSTMSKSQWDTLTQLLALELGNNRLVQSLHNRPVLQMRPSLR